jgi:hypothetical protein
MGPDVGDEMKLDDIVGTLLVDPRKAKDILNNLIDTIDGMTADHPYFWPTAKDLAGEYESQYSFSDYKSTVRLIKAVVNAYERRNANFIKALNASTQMSMDLGVKAAKILYKDAFPSEPE